MDATITVNGTASRRVAPDIGTWLATVEARGGDERAAYAACADALRTVLDATGAAAGTGVEVSAGPINIAQEWDDTGRRRLGSVGSASVAIRGALHQIAPLAQVALDAGASRLDGPVYEVGGRVAVLDELAAAAIDAARARAELMAQAAGRSVGSVVRIVDGAAEPDVRPPGMARAAYAAMEAGPVAPALQELRSDVTVTFTLE